MVKEFIYTKRTELGKIGENTIEIGYFIVNGKQMPDKVYAVSHFTRKNGSEDSKANAICTVEQANELGKILQNI